MSYSGALGNFFWHVW